MSRRWAWWSRMPAIPVSEEVRTVSDLLGLNPMEIANEGVFVAVVASGAASEALDACAPTGWEQEARCVGRVAAKIPRHGHHHERVWAAGG